MTDTSQTALIVIAVAVSAQTLLLLAVGWYAYRAWSAARLDVERHLTRLLARVDTLSHSAEHALRTFDRGADTMSAAFASGERVAGAVARAVATPKALLLAGFVRSVAAGWRRRSRRVPSFGR